MKRTDKDFENLASPTERSAGSAADDPVAVGHEGSFEWASGAYDHIGASNPSSTVLEILSLISKSEEDNSGGVKLTDMK